MKALRMNSVENSCLQESARLLDCDLIERRKVSDMKGLNGAPAMQVTKTLQNKREGAAVCFRTPARGGALGCRVRSGH